MTHYRTFGVLSDRTSVLTPEGIMLRRRQWRPWLFGLAPIRWASVFTRQRLLALFTTPSRDDLLFLYVGAAASITEWNVLW